MSSSIETFVDAIAEPRLPGMFNPWSQSCETELSRRGWEDRKKRLRNHLECPDPKLLIIGEAPGYQGCRFSGIAFTSERLLLEGSIPRIFDLQGQRITERARPWSEPSATIVWKALYEFGIEETTVMFNAVPWHPEGAKGPLSNRTPTKSEKNAGIEYLDALIEIFDGITVATLGNTASENLETMVVEHTKLRHPANGGATKFRNGLADICKFQKSCK